MDSRGCVFHLNKYFMTNTYARAFSRQSTKRRSLYFLPRYFYFSREDNFMFPSRRVRRSHSSRDVKRCKARL